MNSKSKVPQIRFEGFSEEWGKSKLCDLSESLDYGLNSAATKYDGKNKYIRITDIDENSRAFNINDLTSPKTDLNLAENYILCDGDILFARTGASVGKTYIYKNKDGLVYYAGFLIRARIKQGVNSNFVFQNTLTKKYDKFIKLTSQRSGQPGVNAQEYSNYELLIPNQDEQTKIGDYFQHLDKLIEQKEKKYQKLKQFKKAMLSKMFPKNGADTPEIRFKGFSGKWEEKKLGDITNITIGEFVIKTRQNPNSLYPVYNGGKSYTGFYDEFNNEGSKIIISARGANAGFVNFEKRRYWAGNSCYSIDFLDKNLHYIEFFYHYIKKNENKFTDYQQAANIPSVSKADAQKFIVHFPKIEEQTTIGNYFQKLDTQIELQLQEIEKLKNIKKASLANMFV